MNEYNDYLIHFGVKGMKWGVRKDKYKSADKQTRKKYRDEYKKTDEYKKKVSTAKKVGVGVIAGALTLVGGYALAETISYSTTGRSLIDNITNKKSSSINDYFNWDSVQRTNQGNMTYFKNGKSVEDQIFDAGHKFLDEGHKEAEDRFGKNVINDAGTDWLHSSLNDAQKELKKRKQ